MMSTRYWGWGREPSLGVSNRGLDDRIESEPAVPLLRVAPALQRAGHTDRPVAHEVGAVRSLHVCRARCPEIVSYMSGVAA